MISKKIVIFILVSMLIKFSDGNCSIKTLINHPEPLLPLSELETKGESGDLKAQNELAFYYINSSVHQKYQLAAKWFEKAANQGSFFAQFNLGMLYFTGGFGITRDPFLSNKWLNQAAEQGFPVAQYTLGLLYASDIGTLKSYDKAFQCLQKAAEQGYPKAQKQLSKMYERGYGVEKNVYKARFFSKKEFEQKIFVEFQKNLEVMYHDRSEEEHTACFKWFRKAASQGYQLTQKKVAKLYEKQFFIAQNYKETIEYYRTSADTIEIPPLLTNIGFLYANGYGVPQNYQKAMEYYHKSAKQLCSHAQRRLGEMYEKGLGVEKDFKKAIEWYTKAANDLDEEARKSLVRCNELHLKSELNFPVNSPSR